MAVKASGIREPQIRRLRHRGSSSSLTPKSCDAAAEEAAWNLFRIMERFEKEPDTDDYRKVWIPVERGSIEDWANYQEYCDFLFEPYEDEVDPTEELWRRDWELEYPQSSYWHLISISRYQEYLTIAIDGRPIIAVDPRGQSWEDPQDAIDINDLTRSIESIVVLAQKGEYIPLLKRDLPMTKRRGLVRRADLWSLYPDSYDIAPGLDVTERQRRAEKLRAQTERDELNPVKSLTAQEYFSTLKEAYIRTGRELQREKLWRDYPLEDGRAWYCRYGDARDESILEIQQDSPQALIDWETDKTNFKNHTFEIFSGHGFSRCMLIPRLEDAGWRLDLWGSIPFHGEDLFVVWETFNQNGLPTYLHDSQALADAFVGEDYLLVVPDYEWTIYQNGTYEGKKVFDAIHLPDEHTDEVSALIKWFPLDVSPIARECF